MAWWNALRCVMMMLPLSTLRVRLHDTDRSQTIEWRKKASRGERSPPLQKCCRCFSCRKVHVSKPQVIDQHLINIYIYIVKFPKKSRNQISSASAFSRKLPPPCYPVLYLVAYLSLTYLSWPGRSEKRAVNTQAACEHASL